MARAVSWNWQLRVASGPEKWVYPTSIGEFGEGEEGRIDVADGDRKYKIRDQIYAIDEIEVTIVLKQDFREYDIMQEWCLSGSPRDVYIVGVGSGKDPTRPDVMSFLLQNCECAMGKKNAFDRQSKTFDTKKYFLIPEYVYDRTPGRPSAV